MTFVFARKNLERAGYRDIILVQGDGGLGYPELAPYGGICLTAACAHIPSPLLEQLTSGGRLIAPVLEHGQQNLTLVEKRTDGLSTKVLCEVLGFDNDSCIIGPQHRTSKKTLHIRAVGVAYCSV